MTRKAERRPGGGGAASSERAGSQPAHSRPLNKKQDDDRTRALAAIHGGDLVDGAKLLAALLRCRPERASLCLLGHRSVDHAFRRALAALVEERRA